MSPAVSVVVATYNYGHYLPEALESAFDQTLKDLEVVVVDDGSTDNTGEVIDRYRSRGRLVYRCIDHAGHAGAKSEGVRLATAPLVAFLDSDDVWLPTKLERQVALFGQDPELGVVYCRRMLIDAASQPLPLEQPPSLPRGRVVKDMFETNFICFSSAVVRRGVFDEVGLFDQTMVGPVDYDLWLRAALRYRFDYVDEPLVKYRVGHTSLSEKKAEACAIEAMNVMRKFLDVHGGRALISSAAVRRAWSTSYWDLGRLRRKRSRWAALACYAHSLAHAPFYLPSWRGLLTLPLPESSRHWLRRVLRRRPPVFSPGRTNGLANSAPVKPSQPAAT
jgi:glycosyltransferase involved in cell wall biosynthesis